MCGMGGSCPSGVSPSHCTLGGVFLVHLLIFLWHDLHPSSNIDQLMYLSVPVVSFPENQDEAVSWVESSLWNLQHASPGLRCLPGTPSTLLPGLSSTPSRCQCADHRSRTQQDSIVHMHEQPLTEEIIKLLYTVVFYYYF